VISIGGDGTNHALVNAIAAVQEANPHGAPIVYGMFPVGTGQDWARNAGIPLDDIQAAADWVANAQPHPTDIGLLTFDQQREHFLNIASAGLGGEVDKRVNRAAKRRPWTFLAATVSAILTYRPNRIRVTLDGQPWYDGKALLVAVANGSTFGHGMNVVLVEDASKLETLMALRRVYDGSHLSHPAVQFRKAKGVDITSDVPLSLDLDGEYASAHQLQFQLRPGLLHLLRQPRLVQA
jgi:diacylglycerol kinase (ATP)